MLLKYEIDWEKTHLQCLIPIKSNIIYKKKEMEDRNVAMIIHRFKHIIPSLVYI